MTSSCKKFLSSSWKYFQLNECKPSCFGLRVLLVPFSISEVLVSSNTEHHWFLSDLHPGSVWRPDWSNRASERDVQIWTNDTSHNNSMWFHNRYCIQWQKIEPSVSDFTRDVSPCLAKPLLKFNFQFPLIAHTSEENFYSFWSSRVCDVINSL